MVYKNYQEIITHIQKRNRPSRVALVAAEDVNSLRAVQMAVQEKISVPLLIGNKQRIRDLMRQMGIAPEKQQIVDTASNDNYAQVAVDILHAQEADFLMKGKIKTTDLLKPVVDKKNGLQKGCLISHLAFFEMPSFHKLLIISDGGIVPYPDLWQKKQIIINAVEYLRHSGYEKPKVAVLAGVEQVNEKMPETLDAAELKKMNRRGEIDGCIIEGPISYDLAICEEAARIKDYTCSLCGDFDVLIVPNLVAGNILSKALVYHGKAKMAGIVVGAKALIALSSRGSSAEEKYLSLVLAAAAHSAVVVQGG